MRREELVEIFDILSNDVRLCILTNLYKNGEKKVSDLQVCSNSSQSFVSQQLSKLKALKVVEARRDGKEVYYSLKNEKIGEIISKLEI